MVLKRRYWTAVRGHRASWLVPAFDSCPRRNTPIQKKNLWEKKMPSWGGPFFKKPTLKADGVRSRISAPLWTRKAKMGPPPSRNGPRANCGGNWSTFGDKLCPSNVDSLKSQISFGNTPPPPIPLPPRHPFAAKAKLSRDGDLDQSTPMVAPIVSVARTHERDRTPRIVVSCQLVGRRPERRGVFLVALCPPGGASQVLSIPSSRPRFCARSYVNKGFIIGPVNHNGHTFTLPAGMSGPSGSASRWQATPVTFCAASTWAVRQPNICSALQPSVPSPSGPR